MPTIIYTSPIFGPVRSRRLGVSLGINLQPGDGKVCTFDCIYCECGLNAEHRPRQPRPKREEVASALEQTLQGMLENGERLDDICFAGNGEPTGHPQFGGIVDDVLALRDRYFPKASVSVLSNATFIHLERVRQALTKVDNNILKLDTVSADYIRLIDRPVSESYHIGDIIRDMQRFEGHVIVQTMFMKGRVGEQSADNTSDEFVRPWLSALRAIRPERVTVYTIDRDTPCPTLKKATAQELDRIRDLVVAEGFPCIVAY